MYMYSVYIYRYICVHVAPLNSITFTCTCMCMCALLSCPPPHSIPIPPQEAAPLLDPKSIPPIIETDDIPRRKLEKPYKAPTAELIAYLDFNVSTTGVLSGVKVCDVCAQHHLFILLIPYIHVH